MTCAPQYSNHHTQQQRRHREKQSVVVQIQGERAKMRLRSIPALLQIVEVVVEFAFRENREKARFLETAPRDHPQSDGVEVLEKLLVQELVK